MKYLKKTMVYWGMVLFIIAFYNFYFIYLLPDINMQYLVYLDFLIFLTVGIIFIVMFYKDKKKEEIKGQYLDSSEIVSFYLKDYDNIDIALHDRTIFQKQLQEQYEINQDLQDYIARWCHEIKLPLAASMLMNEEIGNEQLKEQLEKMNIQLNTALLGCKVQSSLYDIQFKKIDLLTCVNTSIKNNRYFLIKDNFRIDIEVADSYVYSDRNWIVYILDQIIANAIKYKTTSPKLKIWCEEKDEQVFLYIKDYGEGISETDISRIFEKGYTGSNYHNGQYRSTGMGLYMVKLICDKLEHHISVISEVGKYTQFCITFSNNEAFFNL